MPKLEWDQAGTKLFETGVQQGALYPQISDGTYPAGVAWSGLVSVKEKPTGAEASPIYADNILYANLMSAEKFEASVEAFMYPTEFEACDGSASLAEGVLISQQDRTPFGLAYKTLIGNDTESLSYGYKIHLIYGALAAPSEKSRDTVNDSPEAITFSWEIKTTPVAVTGMKPTAKVTIDSTTVDPIKLAAFEKIIYGDTATPARLPLPDEVKTLFAAG